MENIVSTDGSVKNQITDSISKNLTNSDLESRDNKRNLSLNGLSSLLLLERYRTFDKIQSLRAKSWTPNAM